MALVAGASCMMQHHKHYILSFAAMTFCYMGKSSGIFCAVDVTLSLRGKSRHRLVVRTSRCGRDNPASTSGEDAVATGDSNVIIALACSPGHQGLPKAPFRLLCLPLPWIICPRCAKDRASVIQWYNASLPSMRPGFDSRLTQQ